MVHTELNFIHEAALQLIELPRKSYLTQNESESTTEHNSIVEHDFLWLETSWSETQVQITTSIYMLHEITKATTNVSKSSETKSFLSELRMVLIYILPKKVEQYDIDFE